MRQNEDTLKDQISSYFAGCTYQYVTYMLFIAFTMHKRLSMLNVYFDMEIYFASVVFLETWE